MTHMGNVINHLGKFCYYVRSNKYLSDLIHTSNIGVDFPKYFFSQFMQDASDVMQLLLKTQTDFSDMEDDDPQVKQSSHIRPDAFRSCRKHKGKCTKTKRKLVIGFFGPDFRYIH